jgi:hypothetical protein
MSINVPCLLFSLDIDGYLSIMNTNTGTIYMFSYNTEIHYQTMDMFFMNQAFNKSQLSLGKNNLL